MRKFQILCMAVMLSGTVGCSTQLPTMNGDSLMASGSSSSGTHNNGNSGDWDNSGNVTQSNSAAIALGNNSKIDVTQTNAAVGNAAQQIGDGNNISSGKGKISPGKSSNNNNDGEWADSGNSDQSNSAAIAAGYGSTAKLRQKNDAVGATAQQIGNSNNLSTSSSKPKSSKPTYRWGS